MTIKSGMPVAPRAPFAGFHVHDDQLRPAVVAGADDEPALVEEEHHLASPEPL